MRCTCFHLHNLSLTSCAWNRTVLVVIYCKAISNLKRLPAQSYPLSASSLMSDGIKEQSHHFIFAVDPALWYFQSAYINNPLLSTTTMGKTQFSEKRGVKCPTFWRRIIPVWSAKTLATRPNGFKVFSGAPWKSGDLCIKGSRCKPGCTRGYGCLRQRNRVDSLIRFPPRCVSPKTLWVQLKSINAETSTCLHTLRLSEWLW